VLCLYEDEVVLLQDRLLQGGLGKGLPGITYELADLQVRGRGVTSSSTSSAAAAAAHYRSCLVINL
jgi:hypothetical protein